MYVADGFLYKYSRSFGEALVVFTSIISFFISYIYFADSFDQRNLRYIFSRMVFRDLSGLNPSLL